MAQSQPPNGEPTTGDSDFDTLAAGSGVETGEQLTSEDAVDGLFGSSHDSFLSSGVSSKEKDKAVIEQLQRKIDKTKERIKEEQNAKEANVNEYLRVSSNQALSISSNYDKQQQQRIKTDFEKRNRRSTQLVSQLQKKLEQYKHNLREVHQHGSAALKHNRDFKQGLKDTGASIRDGISGFTGGVVDNIRGAKESFVSKPKEKFAHLMKHRYKSGSTGDIHNMKLDEEQSEEAIKHAHAGSSSLPMGTKPPSEHDEVSSDISGSGTSANQSSPNPLSMTTSQHADHEHDLEILGKITRDAQLRSQEVEAMKIHMQAEFDIIRQQIKMEHFRNERLDEQLNELTELHHDLTELHQHEITNIKQELSSMEEKMEYQLEERTRDMHEMLDTCQTRITKMELQQQQQQLISMEGFENSNFRALITKLVNVALALLAVVLVLVSTVVNLLSPFLATRHRILNTIILLSLIFVIYHNWDFFKGHILTCRSFFVDLFDK